MAETTAPTETPPPSTFTFQDQQYPITPAVRDAVRDRVVSHNRTITQATVEGDTETLRLWQLVDDRPPHDLLAEPDRHLETTTVDIPTVLERSRATSHLIDALELTPVAAPETPSEADS